MRTGGHVVICLPREKCNTMALQRRRRPRLNQLVLLPLICHIWFAMPTGAKATDTRTETTSSRDSISPKKKNADGVWTNFPSSTQFQNSALYGEINGRSHGLSTERSKFSENFPEQGRIEAASDRLNEAFHSSTLSEVRKASPSLRQAATTSQTRSPSGFSEAERAHTVAAQRLYDFEQDRDLSKILLQNEVCAFGELRAASLNTHTATVQRLEVNGTIVIQGKTGGIQYPPAAEVTGVEGEALSDSPTLSPNSAWSGNTAAGGYVAINGRLVVTKEVQTKFWKAEDIVTVRGSVDSASLILAPTANWSAVQTNSTHGSENSSSWPSAEYGSESFRAKDYGMMVNGDVHVRQSLQAPLVKTKQMNVEGSLLADQSDLVADGSSFIVNDGVTVQGFTSISGSMEVGDDMEISALVGPIPNLASGGDIYVTQDMNITGNITVEGDLIVKGNLQVDGSLIIRDPDRKMSSFYQVGYSNEIPLPGSKYLPPWLNHSLTREDLMYMDKQKQRQKEMKDQTASEWMEDGPQAEASENLVVDGNVTVDGSLRLSGDADFAGAVSVAGATNVAQSMDVDGAFFAALLPVVGEDLRVSGELAVGADARINGTLVAGSMVVANEGSVSVAGNADINRLGVGGNLSTPESLKVSGDLDVCREASVGGDLTVGHDVQVDGNLTLFSRLTVNESASVACAVQTVNSSTSAEPSSVTVGGRLSVGGSLFSGSLSVPRGDGFVKGDASVTGASLQVGGDLVSGRELDQSTVVQAAMRVDGDFTALGASSEGKNRLGGGLSTMSRLSVSQQLQTGNSVLVQGAATVQSGGVEAPGQFSTGGDLELCNGRLVLADGGMTVGNRLCVNSMGMVKGSTTIRQGATIDGCYVGRTTLRVGDDTRIGATLLVKLAASLFNSMTVYQNAEFSTVYNVVGTRASFQAIRVNAFADFVGTIEMSGGVSGGIALSEPCFCKPGVGPMAAIQNFMVQLEKEMEEDDELHRKQEQQQQQQDEGVEIERQAEARGGRTEPASDSAEILVEDVPSDEESGRGSPQGQDAFKAVEERKERIRKKVKDKVEELQEQIELLNAEDERDGVPSVPLEAALSKRIFLSLYSNVYDQDMENDQRPMTRLQAKGGLEVRGDVFADDGMVVGDDFLLVGGNLTLETSLRSAESIAETTYARRKNAWARKREQAKKMGVDIEAHLLAAEENLQRKKRSLRELVVNNSVADLNVLEVNSGQLKLGIDREAIIAGNDKYSNRKSAETEEISPDPNSKPKQAKEEGIAREDDIHFFDNEGLNDFESGEEPFAAMFNEALSELDGDEVPFDVARAMEDERDRAERAMYESRKHSYEQKSSFCRSLNDIGRFFFDPGEGDEDSQFWFCSGIGGTRVQIVALI